MLPANKNYYIVWDRKAKGPYLAWKKGIDFYAEFMGEYKIDRVIVSCIPVILPSNKNANNWILADEEKPFVRDMYDVSPDILTYDSKQHAICECFYTYGMSGSEWCDSESMGAYDRQRYDPDYWKPMPTIEDMERIVKGTCI
jgi:hypothetical protein